MKYQFEEITYAIFNRYNTAHALYQSSNGIIYPNHIYVNSSSNRIDLDFDGYYEQGVRQNWNPWSKNSTISLKYVPAKVKNRDYNSFNEWLNACIAFLKTRREKAKDKRYLKTENQKHTAVIDFIGIKDELKRIFQESNMKKKYDYDRNNQFTLEYLKKTGVGIVVNKSALGKATVTIKSVDPEKLVEFVKTAISVLK